MGLRIVIILMLITLSFPQKLGAQLYSYQFEELDSLNAVDTRPIVVFIHTDWCKYCQKMKNVTLKNDETIESLNTKFYFVSFDAETKEDISFLGRTFKYQPTGNNSGVHELAKELGTINGKLNYPTVTILNKKNEIAFQWDGYLDSPSFHAVLSKF